MKPSSIRSRMTMAFAFSIAALMLLVSLALVEFTRYSEDRRATELLRQCAAVVQDEIHEQIDRPASDDALVREIGEELHSSDIAVMLVDGQGRVVAQTEKDVPPGVLSNDNWRVQTLNTGGHRFLLAYSWYRSRKHVRELSSILFLISILVVLASSLGAWVLVGRTLSPISLLARQAQTASVDNLRVRLTAPSNDDEITEMVATFNSLLERLSAAAASKGRFYAAASHELRTPLQAMSGHLELSLTRQRNADEYRATLQEVQGQSRQLVSLVQDLLLLNQLDSGSGQSLCEPVDLVDVCERVVGQLQPLIEERGLKVVTNLPADMELNAPWNHVQMLVRNLLENAIKYATHGGKVEVVLEGSAAGPVLTVFNECAPVEGWEADKFFEPFFRPDASRNSQTGGNGLGLAICKAAAGVNGWAVALQQEPGGVRACVTFCDTRQD